MAEPFRALIIDDDPDLLMLVRRTLEFTAGWEVATARSGVAGVELARTPPVPQVVLVDVMMPEMDGYEVCRRLKADPATAPVPIVLLTARRDLNKQKVAERSEEHTSELQSLRHLVCRLLLEKKKQITK